MRARIKVDAFADLTLDGEIIEIAPLPDPRSTSSSEHQGLPTRIRIDRKSAASARA